MGQQRNHLTGTQQRAVEKELRLITHMDHDGYAVYAPGESDHVVADRQDFRCTAANVARVREEFIAKLRPRRRAKAKQTPEPPPEEPQANAEPQDPLDAIAVRLGNIDATLALLCGELGIKPASVLMAAE